MMPAPSVLFICYGNACRSPMAEGLARRIGEGRWQAASAGTVPLGWVSDEVLEALEEVGAPTDGLRSKGLDEFDLDRFDAVVILTDHCPDSVIPPGYRGRVERWPTPDPVGSPIEAFRRVRGMLEGRIEGLLHQLVAETT
jgi:arsenate reductase